MNTDRKDIPKQDQDKQKRFEDIAAKFMPNVRKIEPDYQFPQDLINYQAKYDRVDKHTLLMAAAHTGNWNAVQLLLEQKADPNMVDSTGRTALHYAMDAVNYLAAPVPSKLIPIVCRLMDVTKLTIQCNFKDEYNNGAIVRLTPLKYADYILSNISVQSVNRKLWEIFVESIQKYGSSLLELQLARSASQEVVDAAPAPSTPFRP